jgi:hypothetical protein
MRRFLRGLDFFRLLRDAHRGLGVGGDFSLGKLVLTIVAMLLVGAKRLEQLRFMSHDPLLLRFAGASRMPTARSLGRALGRMSWRTWPELERLSTAMVRQGTQPLNLRRWTLDIDGSVLSTGLQVERAERGYNPHHRKNPSYFPILATLAQTGHVVGHLNRRDQIKLRHRALTPAR